MGITRGERRPLALESALGVLAAPDVEAWLGGEPVAGLESLYRSQGDGRGGVARSYEVVVHKKGGAAFSREVPVL